MICGQGCGDSLKDCDASWVEREGDPGLLSYNFDLKWSLSFENKDGGCRYEDVLTVKSSASVTVNKRTGEVLVKSAELGDSWEGVKRLERGDPRLVCSLAPKRLVELAKSAPESCAAFMRRCAKASEDLCLAAELTDILRERGLAEPAPEPADCEVSTPIGK